MSTQQWLPSIIRTPIAQQLGCTYPILSAGMGGVARSELAAAVCNAGGFGCLGMVREPLARIRHEVEQTRALTDRSFGVNLIPAATDKTLLNAQIDLCIALNVPVVCLFWDVDQASVLRLKDAGVMVLHQIGSLADAEQALHAGCDVLIAQGVEAGGHVRGLRSTLSLVVDLVAITDVPVVACGGIATGGALIAALAAGAQAVCCGTAFLACREANAHPYHQARICDASGDETLYTTQFFRNWPMAAPVRVLPNSVTAGDHCGLENGDPIVIGKQDDLPVHLFSTDSPLRDATGDVSAMALYAGQSCGQIRSVVSAAERIDVLLNEALTAIDKFGY